MGNIHVLDNQRLVSAEAIGYEAEIDSYIDSDEYQGAYGENTVPYARSTSSQLGFKNSSYVRGFTLLRGDATSDRSGQAKLIGVTAGNGSGTVTAPAAGSGAADNTGKRYRIAVAKAGLTPIYKQSNLVYEVGYAQMSQKIQNIHKTGGKILSITEVA